MADEIILEELPPIEPIVVDDVTSGLLPGTGAFDEFMSAHQVRLEREFNQNRIKSSDYAKVYLGAMESSMQQAIGFVLGRQEATAKAHLTYQQGQLIQVEIFNAIKQGQLIDKQIIKMDAEIDLLQKQSIKMDSEILVMEQEVLLKQQQVENLAAELPKILAETQLIEETVKLRTQEVLNMIQTVEKSKAEVKLITQQIANAKVDNKLKERQLLMMDHEEYLVIQKGFEAASATQDSIQDKSTGVFHDIKGTAGRQFYKLDREGYILQYKGYTEAAQTRDGITSDGKFVPVSADSIIGRQKALYKAQTDGFARDAEQKLAKIMSEAYSVQRATDEALPPPALLGEQATNLVMEKAGNGIGIYELNP